MPNTPSNPDPHTSRTEAGPRPPREPSRPDTRGCSQGRAPGGQGAGVCAHHCSAVSSGLLVLGSDGDHRGGELCRSTQGWRGAGPERAARTGRVKPGPRAGPGRAGPQQAAQGGAGPGDGLAFTRNLWSPATCCRGVPAPMRPGTRCLSQHHELPDENAGSRQGRDQTPATDPRPARPTAPGACPRPRGVDTACESSRATRSRNARAKNVFQACLGRRRAPGRGPHLAHLRAVCQLLSGPERHGRAREQT